MKLKERDIAKVAIAQFALIGSLLFASCTSAKAWSEKQSENRLLKIAEKTSCENPLIVRHPQDYIYGVKVEGSRFISANERRVLLSAMGFETQEHKLADCEDPRIREYNVYHPVDSDTVTSTLKALHATPWQIDADPSITCKNSSKYHYKPAVTTGGNGTIEAVSGEKLCKKNSLSFSTLPEELRILLSFDELVSDVDDVLVSCEEAVEFEDTYEEYVDAFAFDQYSEMKLEDVNKLVDTRYNLYLLHADVCDKYSENESFKDILSKVADAEGAVLRNDCYEQSNVWSERKLPPRCGNELMIIVKIVRVYAKSLEKNFDKLDTSDTSLVESIRNFNRSAENRLSVYLRLLAKYNQPTVDVHDNLGPYNSSSMVIRFISADALNSINRFKRGSKWN